MHSSTVKQEIGLLSEHSYLPDHNGPRQRIPGIGLFCAFSQPDTKNFMVQLKMKSHYVIVERKGMKRKTDN